MRTASIGSLIGAFFLAIVTPYDILPSRSSPEVNMLGAVVLALCGIGLAILDSYENVEDEDDL